MKSLKALQGLDSEKVAKAIEAEAGEALPDWQLALAEAKAGHFASVRTPVKSRPFDMANYLRSEEEIAEYLRQVLEDNDPAELASALGHVARARGMPQLAKETGLSRESL